jgi:hypothetical protein
MERVFEKRKKENEGARMGPAQLTGYGWHEISETTRDGSITRTRDKPSGVKAE